MAPIRWPHMNGAVLALIGVWLAGVLLALFVPALIVPPTEEDAPTGDVLLAVGCTAAGSLIMIGVGVVFMRRHDEPLLGAFPIVSGVTFLVGGMILAATKLTGG